MDNLYQPDQSLLSYIDIQAAIETTREANDIVIPALQTSVNEFAADELQMLAAKTNNQRLATQTKMRERREELIKKVELQLAKSAWKAEEKNSKQRESGLAVIPGFGCVMAEILNPAVFLCWFVYRKRGLSS